MSKTCLSVCSQPMNSLNLYPMYIFDMLLTSLLVVIQLVKEHYILVGFSALFGAMLVSALLFWKRFYLTMSRDDSWQMELEKREASNDDIFLLLFYNQRSGGFQGNYILNSVTKHLDHVLAFSVQDRSLPMILKLITPTSKMRIMICGGDGTVSWVLQILRQAGWEMIPPICLAPLGTGNDLARAFDLSKLSVSDSLASLLVENIASQALRVVTGCFR